MKKYEKPVAEKVEFEFKSQVVASGGNTDKCLNEYSWQGVDQCDNPQAKPMW